MSLKVASSTRRRWLFPGAPTVVSWPVIWLASTQGSTRPAWLAILSSIWPLWFAALTSQTGTSWHAHSHTHAHICLLISWLCQLRTTTQHLLFYHLYPCSQIWQLYASKWDKGHVSTSLSRKEVFNNAHWVILFILSFCWCSNYDFCRCMVEAGFDYSTDCLPDPAVWEQMLNKSPIKHVTQVCVLLCMSFDCVHITSQHVGVVTQCSNLRWSLM